MCYCAAIPRIETTTKIVILQHPRERDMPIGTARMASLCLPGAELFVGVQWDDHAPLRTALADPTHTPILLYPGAEARDILTEPPPGPVTLVVIDGTWAQAKTLVRDNPVLHALPRYAFETPEPSHYRIRREPRAEYCSTIEAVMHALGALEGDPAKFRRLLDPFHAMVDAQLACQARRPRRPMNVRVPRPEVDRRTRLPSALRERFDDLVLVVPEANAWPYSDTKPPDELVHVVALRPATGERFEQLAAPMALAPSTTFHVDLPAERLRSAPPLAELLVGFERFLRPTDILGAWGYYGLDLLAAAGAPVHERLDLRATTQRYLHRKLGSLESFAATLDMVDVPAGDGRANRRLLALARVVASLRAPYRG